MLFHTRFNSFFLRHLVKPTTRWKQQRAHAGAAQNKGSEPKTKMLGYRRGCLATLRLQACCHSESSLCQCRQVLFHLYCQISYKYQSTLAFPALSFLCIYQSSSSPCSYYWLLFWHTDFLWMTTSSLRVWEWVAVFSCNLMGENVRIFMPVFTIAFSYALSNILWAGFKWSEREKG